MKQLQAYVAWVNSQLKKRPGAQPIEDLREMKDGVALAKLIEIVANEELVGIFLSPVSHAEMISNVEKVLQFMTSHRIRMHRTSAADIVQGNLKSIMRLILALAAQYKPKSVKQSGQPVSSTSTGPAYAQSTLIGIAHGAAAALADARREVSDWSQRPARPPYLDSRLHGRHPAYSPGRRELAATDQGAGEAGAHQAEAYRSGVAGDWAAGGGDPGAAAPVPPSPSRVSRRLELDDSDVMDDVVGTSGRYGPDQVPQGREERGDGEEDEVSRREEEEAAAWHGLKDDLDTTKEALFQLRDLLLSGQPPDAEQDEKAEPCAGASAQEQLVITQARLDQLELACSELRAELATSRNQVMELVGTKAGLQKRLGDQEEGFLKVKAELLRVGFAQQSLVAEKSELERKTQEKDQLILDLRRELTQRDRQLEELVASLQYQQQEKQIVTCALHAQIVDLHEKLQLVGETEESLAQRVAKQECQMALLESQLFTQQDGARSPHSSDRLGQGSDSELDSQRAGRSPGVPRTGVAGVRAGGPALRMGASGLVSSGQASFAAGSSAQAGPSGPSSTSLDQSISYLLERLQISRMPSVSGSPDGLQRLKMKPNVSESRKPVSLSSLHKEGLINLESSSSSSSAGDAGSTKVLYFMDRAITPFMFSIPRRLGEITLRDFKEMFDRHGNYRFHFKAVDPEFGTVKEEITQEDDIIPGWEGKIVAWIEEDDG